MKQTVTVLGISVTVNTQSTDPTYFEDLARYVEAAAQKISSGNNLPFNKLAVMTCLTLADEIFQNAAQALPAERRGPARVEALIEKIESILKQG